MAKDKRMEKRADNSNLKNGKLKKFFRLLSLLTVKKYGLLVILEIYYTQLLGTAIKAMDSIWGEFLDFQNCQEEYIASVGDELTESYNEAAHSLAKSTAGKAECLAGPFDVCKAVGTSAKGVADIASGAASSVKKLVGRRRILADCTTGLTGKAFGWLKVDGFRLPRVNTTIVSNTAEVVKDIEDDISVLKDVAKWTQIAGVILALLSIGFIVFTALLYTIRNKRWKPTPTSYAMHLLNFVRVFGAYGLALLVILLQAYFTEKFCGVSITSITMDAPDCVVDKDCGFDCQAKQVTFLNECEKCDIKLHWWWVEVFSTPNILAVVYLIFLCFILGYERVEARREKQAMYHRQLDDGERRRKKQKKKSAEQLVVGDADDSSSVQQQETRKDNDNVLDGPVSNEGGASHGHKREESRYESSVYIYPDTTSSGGFY